jgi:hypothetical protein
MTVNPFDACGLIAVAVLVLLGLWSVMALLMGAADEED